VKADLVLNRADFALMRDEHGAFTRDTSIAIADGQIVAIGDDMPAADRVIDARNHLVMPGLVNLHTHLAMTLLRGVAEDVDLQGFLEKVWAEEARVMNPHGVYVGTRLGALEALLSGTTTALDMYFHPAAAHKGAVEVGLRHVGGPVFFSFAGPDNLTWGERIALAQTWPSELEKMGGPYVPPALMPHAPFTVGIELLTELAQLAKKQGALVHTHASENEKENSDTIEITGQRPVPALATAGVLDLAPVLGHGVMLDAHDQSEVARTNTAIAHNPGSNLKLASGAADIVAYRNQKIRVGIGTDGCSSSNDLDMFQAMRLAANLARLVRRDPAAISAREIVQAATVEGAKALRLDGRIGTLEVGKEADLIAIDLAQPHLVPMHDPYTGVVFSAGRGDVRHVVVAGVPVVLDRRPTLVQAADVMAAAAEVVGVTA
jgi:5-methylthioadenosine/S-adenosylhomocysteine deaminase